MTITGKETYKYHYPMPTLLPQTKALKSMHLAMRDRHASQELFVHCAGRITRLLLEQAIDLLPFDEATASTPAGADYHGYKLTTPVCGVSIMRAGDAMEFQLRQIMPDAPIGKILIQRNKETHLPKFHFANLPPDIGERSVLLLDPMLATGGTAVEAIGTLEERGVAPENIVFVTILSVANGLHAVHKAYPDVRVVTSSIEEELNENAFMMPGIGDFGDRYFGTYVIPPRPA